MIPALNVGRSSHFDVCNSLERSSNNKSTIKAWWLVSCPLSWCFYSRLPGASAAQDGSSCNVWLSMRFSREKAAHQHVHKGNNHGGTILMPRTSGVENSSSTHLELPAVDRKDCLRISIISKLRQAARQILCHAARKISNLCSARKLRSNSQVGQGLWSSKQRFRFAPVLHGQINLLLI